MFCLLFFLKRRILKNFESFIIPIREKMNELSLDEKIKICDTQKNGSGEEIEAGKNRVGNNKTSYENL